VVWANLMVGTLIGSTVLRSVTGEQSEFTRNPWVMLDTGFLAGTMMLAWLIVGPVVKTLYAVRCFHGLSRRTGEDLLVDLKRWSVT
jgi:hypothetical protein